MPMRAMPSARAGSDSRIPARRRRLVRRERAAGPLRPRRAATRTEAGVFASVRLTVDSGFVVVVSGGAGRRNPPQQGLRERVAALAGRQLVQRGLHGLQRRGDRLGAVQHGRQELRAGVHDVALHDVNFEPVFTTSPCTTLSSIGYAVNPPLLTRSSICWFTGLLVVVPVIAGMRPAALMIVAAWGVVMKSRNSPSAFAFGE